MASKSNSVWVWCPVQDGEKAFRHPADIPFEDEAAAKSCFGEGLRGPQAARISPVNLLQSKGNVALIAEKGATREVPKHMVLPWYEGMLILETLEAGQGKNGYIKASWWNQELKGLLDKERSKSATGRLNGTLYAEKRLLNSCRTGSRFVDSEEREFNYWRENIKVDDQPLMDSEEDKDGFFRIKDVVNYIPPWEAFINEKCGFYQDFYQVKWAFPFSEIDYSAVENGCASTTGATWEPDECLPAFLDSLRIAAKRSWIKRRQQQPVMPSGPPPANGVKKEKVDDESSPPFKMARIRRDGAPLERDLLRSKAGHDFVPTASDKELSKIRSGWPKQAQDYPKGFAVAGPPGFCWEKCDCMDDQRPQRPWETSKAWLEDPSRSQAALAAIASFSGQSRFVRRRGQVSKQCFFETAQGNYGDLTKARAALDLGQTIEKVIKAVLSKVPVASLLSDAEPVRIPGRLFVTEDRDYPPCRYAASVAGGAALPNWCRVEPDDGRIVVTTAPPSSELPLQIQAELFHSEGRAAHATCTIVSERFSPSQAPWLLQTSPIALRYSDPSKCPLESGVRAALLEHFSDVYDFSRSMARDRTLGKWLETMIRIFCLLRAAAGTNLALTSAK